MGNTQDKNITKFDDKSITKFDDKNITKISNRQIAPKIVEPLCNNICKCDNNANDVQNCKECCELYEKRKHTKKCF